MLIGLDLTMVRSGLKLGGREKEDRAEKKGGKEGEGQENSAST